MAAERGSDAPERATGKTAGQAHGLPPAVWILAVVGVVLLIVLQALS